jgi:hypothetical protein
MCFSAYIDESEKLIEALQCALKLAPAGSLTAHLVQMAILNEATQEGRLPIKPLDGSDEQGK